MIVMDWVYWCKENIKDNETGSMFGGRKGRMFIHSCLLAGV